MRSADSSPRVLLLFTEVFANGGIQRFNQTLLAALSELDVSCNVLSMRDTADSIARRPLPRNVRAIGFNGNRLRFAIATALALWRRRYDWVLIGHVNLLPMTVAALSAKLVARTRTILITHGIEVWYGMGRSRRYALRQMSTILCVSHYTRQRLLEQVASLERNRLRIFPNALGKSWSDVQRRNDSGKPLQQFILSVTRLQKSERYKGVVTVIEALSMLEDTTLQYIVVGDGDDIGFLRAVAGRCGVSHRVHFLRGIGDDELINLYGQCEAFVLPSGNEGFGIVFLEAMYFGAPVIAAAEKGALDVVRNGQNGLLIRFGDCVALKQAIERLTSDAALCARLRQAGRATVVAGGEFTFSRFVDRAAEILEISRSRAA